MDEGISEDWLAGATPAEVRAMRLGIVDEEGEPTEPANAPPPEPEATEDAPPLDDAPVPPLTAPDDTEGG